ncbi:MAG TPA: outer membrane lipoprotein-sorting protein [Treponema sp.]|jgi:outer membrane lipoprotein-sorting protein|nr:outer membrane lipoprotein-sorting protein [Treponema sp.]HON14643.1 outer membrane lipoprotein-sorting protein [Treponema sp.]HPC71162.1 outer membrane lipoprotein-sorting protein [Treponema sp.]HRS04982.1 outer membrane lipoprotein-sorting protein [Treponema sp.]HRU27898.1 outer membrane lipoprotein-sorting protein [Treponema sp.]
MDYIEKDISADSGNQHRGSARTFLNLINALAVAGLMFAIPSPRAAAQTQPDVKAIITKLDTMNDFSGLDFTGVFTIVSEKPGEKAALTQIRMFRRDSKDQFTLLIQQPEASKGQGYLKEGDNVWFYDPSSRKFTHSSLKENLNNSEAKNSDFSRRSILDDYDISGTEEGTLGKYPIWIISLKAKTDKVSYDISKLFVRKDNNLLLKQEDYSVSGKKMRTTLYPKYADLGNGKMFPSQMLIVDELNPGEKSQITMTELSTNKLPDKVFTKAFLEQVN